jgi:hypothetical protein
MNKKIEARQLLLLCGATIAVLFFSAGMAKEARAVTVITDIDGRLVKGTGAVVYFAGSDNKRYAFPNEKIFYSWYQDFSTVQAISDTELAAIPLGGEVTYKPGARLVKVPEDPKVYVVSGTGELRWVQSEEIAKQLFGDNWAKQVDDVGGSMFANYALGTPIAGVGDYEAAAAKFAIVSVELGKTDSKGLSAESVRSFKIGFNRPYTGGRLTITEKSSGSTFYSEALPLPAAGVEAESVTVWPDNWKGVLKPNTGYVWKIIAYAAANATTDQMATLSGEFMTADFAVGAASSTAAAAFKIISVTVEKTDASGKEAEDVRSFRAVFSGSAKAVRLIITEKASNATFLSQLVNNGEVTPSTLNIGPSGWLAKLKPNTAYAWKIVAYAAEGTADNPYPFDVASGEFTTTNF